ncbi:undecaprenyldiphospho-muramoylpentapeptide beta-N-acetylglucosaminyltransferase [Colwellia echini]|uniref:UDP-N-acetylglucosamine--N-acetylmuramyl-(pentapeptide) pyrophosphoryl-undecaprenol N-acetylglucosamine transferase n=1 Tax=Colwellia echini TaxID=1982103 RepID=A0ABY3MW68_9GAMM|nr:undecaprenyldiphospho-muramoylpentapeptide beta-N-acetylglucosaminyltransferase [Colwellia echini]TYK65349.1 undecaprenyldiphospho-muramoylpentapeptide beta-N-acetylglucosaminyltransferase [Colwellia echini]
MTITSNTTSSINNTATKSPTLLVMAGGTGGHIFPGIAVADELKAQGWKIHWLGTADRMEAKIVPAHGYDISFLNISGLRGKKLLTMLTTPFKLLRSVLQARRVIKTVKPDVVLGMGGYASAPGGLAAWLAGVPLIVHEQNAAAGLSNRLLARIANKVCCAFPNAFTANVDAQVVGNPLRASIGKKLKVEQSVESLNLPTTKNILVVGGSLGAQVLNTIIPQSFNALQVQNKSYCIWHQTGAGNQEEVIASYQEVDITQGKVKVSEFIADMAAAYEWADIVICRAGALTVSELAMAGTPAIFVPLPHAVDDHQTKNALYLVERGAAKLLPQTEFNKESITTLITELFGQPETLAKMAKASLGAANSQASKQVAILCQQLVGSN